MQFLNRRGVSGRGAQGNLCQASQRPAGLAGQADYPTLPALAARAALSSLRAARQGLFDAHFLQAGFIGGQNAYFQPESEGCATGQ